MDPRNVADRIDQAEELDRVADPVHRAVRQALPAGVVKDALHGVWLGHPLHPVLTDLPIGFWTSAFVLDLVPLRRFRPAADAMVALGVATALPTAASGWADWSDLDRPARRTGIVHAAANVAAILLYTGSLVARLRGRRTRGIALGMAGATAATAGAYLGGHLTFRRGAGVDHTHGAPAPDGWVPAAMEETGGALTTGEVEGEPIVATGPDALYDRCSHAGGPLHEGELEGGCVRCPWHGSTFEMATGAVRSGPATHPQPAYELDRASTPPRARRKPLP